MTKPHFIPPSGEKTYEVSEDELPPSASRILLLEDQVELSEHLVEFLRSKGYIVTAVINGVDGLKNILAANFDAIVCDMMMPQMPGDMFYRAVERVKPALCKRFIFITGHQGEARVADFLKQVRGLALYKPFQMSVLAEYVEMVLKKSR